MESSQNPAIVRMYLYLRGFSFLIKHIPGTKNKLADYLSRLEEPVPELLEISLLCESKIKALEQVHNADEGHFGQRTTWTRLNTHFPGHDVSLEDITDFITSCITCQKNRRTCAMDQLKAIHRPLPKLHYHYIIGIDFMSITPTSSRGNIGLYVVRNLTTKHTDLYAVTANDAVQAATSIYDYITSYGLVEYIISDPGSDFTSKVVEHVNKYLGLKHQLSIVDRHESNGVERTNQEVLKHLRDYVFDKRIINDWDNPICISTIRYFLNYLVSSETGISPYEATFGSTANTYQKLLEIPKDFPTNNALLTLLNDSIAAASEVLTEHINKIDDKRSKNNVSQAYQPGDYVMLKLNKKKPKLQPPLSGPYKVIKHESNNVLVRHPCKNEDQLLHCENLYIFYGSKEQAIEASLRDDNQYFIDSILDYRGDPARNRTDMTFLVQFMDESQSWVPNTPDINKTEAFETYCAQHRELLVLLQLKANQSKYYASLNAQPLRHTLQNTDAFINLRSWGHEWYDQQNLKHLMHLVPCRILKITRRENKPVFAIETPLFNDGTHYIDARAFHDYIFLERPDFPHVVVDESMTSENSWRVQ
jgi:hypothetical protein